MMFVKQIPSPSLILINNIRLRSCTFLFEILFSSTCEITPPVLGADVGLSVPQRLFSAQNFNYQAWIEMNRPLLQRKMPGTIG